MRNTGDRLKECRIMKGLSRGEMSEMLHVSTDYLARLETGTQPVTYRIIEKVAKLEGWNSDYMSGVADQVNVVASRALLEGCGWLERGEEVTVHGEVRTFNNRSGVGSRLIISVFAKELLLEQGEDENRLLLSGTLCKPPSLRSTPLGRTICDMILAVNRRYGRADYLPCITWGSLAHQCGGMEVGSTLYFEGRLQSRTYTKNLGDRTEERVAFEVSVMNLAAREALEPAAL